MKRSVMAVVASAPAALSVAQPPGWGPPGWGPPGGMQMMGCLNDCMTSYYTMGDFTPRCTSTDEYFDCITSSCTSFPTSIVSAMSTGIDSLCSQFTNCPASSSGTYTYTHSFPHSMPGFGTPTTTATVVITGCPLNTEWLGPPGGFPTGPPGIYPTPTPGQDWEEWCQDGRGAWWGGGWSCETRTSTVTITGSGGGVELSTALETVAVSSDGETTTRITIGEGSSSSSSSTTVVVSESSGTETVVAATTTSSVPDVAGTEEVSFWLLGLLGAVGVVMGGL